MLCKDKSCVLATAMALHTEQCNMQGDGGQQEGKKEQDDCCNQHG